MGGTWQDQKGKLCFILRIAHGVGGGAAANFFIEKRTFHSWSLGFERRNVPNLSTGSRRLARIFLRE